MAKKLYFKIGEACKKLGIQPYVLRYWETEFPFLNPDKSKSGQRVYSKRELEVIGRIKDLLYEEGYTIAGAKKKLEAELNTGAVDGEQESAASDSKPADEQPAAKVATEAKVATKVAAKSKSKKAAAASAAAADSATTEELKRLREGVSGALRQAREILDRLGSPAS